MTDFNARPIRHSGRAIAAATAWFVVGAVIMLWSWNAIFVDLFAAPAIDFRQAVAGELMIAVAAANVGLGIRLITSRRQRNSGVVP